jgi:anti-anti-sigma factor
VGTIVVEYRDTDGALCCVFGGRMDTVTCQSLEAEVLAQVREAPGAVVFDLSDVPYVASSFLRLCIQAAKIKTVEGFTLHNPTLDVKKVLMITGFGDLLKVE